MAVRVTDLRTGIPGSAQGSYCDLDDRMLVLDFQAGSPDAFEEIHRRYAGLARHICQRILQNPEDADEATQEAMIRVFQGLGRFNGRYALQPWVARIATNVSLDVTRSRARRPKTDDRTLVDLDQDLRSDDEDPCEHLERAAEREEVLKVLASLPENHREALVLREFEGRSHKEIGDALGATPSQAKALIHRAKGSFRRAWAERERHGLAALLPILAFPLKVRDFFGRLLVPTQELAANASAAPATASTAITTGERVTAAAVAVLVAGSAAVGVVALRNPHQAKPAQSPSAPITLVAPLPVPDRTLKELHTSKAKVSAKIAASRAAIPSLSPSPSPSPSESPSPTESPTPTIPPAPPWSLAFKSSVRIGTWQPQLLSATVIGTPGHRLAFSETVAGPTVTTDGDPAGRLYVEYFGSAEEGSGNVTLWIILDTSQGRFRYEASGSLTGVAETDGGLVDYAFIGSYYPVEWPVADDGSALVTGDAPHDGSFQLDLRFWEDGKSLYKIALALQESEPEPAPPASSS